MIERLFRFRHPLVQLEKHRLTRVGRGFIPEELAPLYQRAVPGPETAIGQLEFLVVDFETSGLDPERDTILSIGMVEIRQQTLSLSSASHFYVAKPQQVKPDTAVINHITPETLAAGVSLEQSIHDLLERMPGKILVAHGAAIERDFLRRALAVDHSADLPVVWLDTLMLERSLATNRGKEGKDYRLCQIRQEKGLPGYLAHNALADSVATGELFLVLLKEIFAGLPPTLGPLYHRSLYGRA